MVRAPLLTSWRSASSSAESVRLNAVGQALHSLRLLAGDGDRRIGGARAQQPRIGADADDRRDDSDEKRRQQLVARHAQREGFEQVDALQVLDCVAHLGQRQRELLAACAQLERRRRALLQPRRAVDAARQLARVVADEQAADRREQRQCRSAAPTSSGIGRAATRVAHPGPDHQSQHDDGAHGQAAREPDQPALHGQCAPDATRAARAARRG